MIIGTPAITIEDDHTDRVGLRTLLLSQMWQPSRWPMSVGELDAERPPTPDVPGGVVFIGRQTRRQGGALRTLWSFEGIEGDGQSVTFKTRGKSLDWGFEPGFSEAPIQRHRRIEALLDKFEGQVIDNEIIWPRTLSGDGGGGTGIGAGKQSSGKINPMFGRDTYFAFQGGTYWYRYMAQSEAEIPDVIGKLFSGASLPGGAPRHAGRNWLCAGAPFLRRGPAVEVTELYWLSDEGGWPKPIYGAGGGGSGSGGVQTGIDPLS